MDGTNQSRKGRAARLEAWTPQQLVREYRFRFKKRFGQNFISDKNLLQSIVQDAGVTPGNWVLEIGPGLGTLTRAAAEAGAQVTAIEIDRELTAILKEHLDPASVTVVEGDALQLDWAQVLEKSGWHGQPLQMVANLPYYITTPLVMKALECGLPFRSVTVMVQHEVALRMAAEPGTSDYGILSLVVQYYAKPQLCRVVSAHSFFPKPDVDSAVMRLDVRAQPPVAAPKEELFTVIKGGFSQRRKKLRNALKQVLKEWNLDAASLDGILENLDIDVNVRGEALALEQFSQITEALLALRTDV